MTDQELANFIHDRATKREIETPDLLDMLGMSRATFWRLRNGGIASRRNIEALTRVAKELRR